MRSRKIQGRVFRAWVGTAAIVLDLVVLGVDHLLRSVVWTYEEVAGHVAVALLGLLLIDPKLASQYVDRLPFVGRSKRS